VFMRFSVVRMSLVLRQSCGNGSAVASGISLEKREDRISRVFPDAQAPLPGHDEWTFQHEPVGLNGEELRDGKVLSVSDGWSSGLPIARVRRYFGFSRCH
jgi:hypothetical protein